MSTPLNINYLKTLVSEMSKLANELRHEMMMPEHMLYVLLNDAKINELCDMLDVTPSELQKKILKHLQSKESMLEVKSHYSTQLDISMDSDSIFKSAVMKVQSSGRTNVLSTDVLYSLYELLDSEESFAKHLLEIEYDIELYDLKSCISDITRESVSIDETTGVSAEDSKKGDRSHKKPDFVINLNERAKDGKIDSLTGRGEEINRMAQILIRRRKNNPVLVGEPGVGKTAIVEGLALKIVKGEVHDKLKNCVIFALDIGSMLAGAKFRGDFEERFKVLISFLKKTPNAILFIDEMHMIMGAGSSSESSMDASNLLKPMLANGEIKLIGSTTFKEMKKIDKDTALARRLQKIDIVEPSIEETVKILTNLKTDLEKHHGITYTDESLKVAVDLAVKYINDKFLPDKAIDVLDEAGSFVVLNTTETEVTKTIIEKVVAKIARMPETTLTMSEKEKMQNLEKNLKLLIYGQDDAVETVTSAVIMSKAGLRKPTKPIANFLFTGPTGVGKTELALQLANQLGVNFERIDCSEYDKEHSSEKLIGSPPGYVGHGEGGILTNAILKHPYSVVLFDEFEKAHPKFWTYLLQIMDHGILTDSEGRKVNFRNCIIIMTSNVGQTEVVKKRIGMVEESDDVIKTRPNVAVANTFSPEFRGRIDKIVNFNLLNLDNAMLILNKKLAEIENLLKEKNVFCEYSKEAKEWLLEKGYVKNMGARPMENAVEEHIAKPLSKEVLFGALSDNGGFVKVDLVDNKLTFTVIEKKEKVKTKKTAKIVK
jgi:ATP-dependent Clp protease ATP-binding subunit ClpA